MNTSTIGRESLRAPSNLIGWLRRAKRKVSNVIWPILDDSLRCLLIVFVLKPASDFLSRRRAQSVARWCGAVMLHMPTSRQAARQTMRVAFGMNDADAAKSAQEYLAQPFYTFVAFRRVLRHREHTDGWVIEERNNHGIAQLRETGRSFIVATGHFRRESHLVLYLTRVCPGKSAAIHLPLTAARLRAHTVLERIQYGQLLRTARSVRPDHIFLWVGDAVRKILKNLAQPNCQVVISVDAFWRATGSSTYTRPFAGMRARTFSTGTAALARLAQRPIVPCVGYVDENDAIILEWGDVIEPPSRDDEAADIRTTDTILDFLEQAIGRRPTQYVIYIGEERRWNPVQKAWENLIEQVQ